MSDVVIKNHLEDKSTVSTHSMTRESNQYYSIIFLPESTVHTVQLLTELWRTV
jgi:hypothetical protein